MLKYTTLLHIHPTKVQALTYKKKFYAEVHTVIAYRHYKKLSPQRKNWFCY